MFTEKKTTKKRGRPPGRTSEGDLTRRRLYETAVALVADRGYAGTTLREVGKRAGVSAALVYRYFPSKRAIVLALYAELSEQYAREAGESAPAGRWRDRVMAAIEGSLTVLGPHRLTLQALVPVMLGDTEEGLLAPSTADSRHRVQAVFRDAVVKASDAPSPALAESVGRLSYLLHLGVILWWLLDRSEAQQATRGLVRLLGRMLPALALALRLPLVRGFVKSADGLAADAFGLG